ncbi:MAG: trypsin-like peptidase domain-containing protein [Candidatus Caenarcaniphilales bacterium]|nr:trypsin-like peptidase domain-containing protein [Candidatus Caenarcaniphilales bacterium]
MFWSNSPPQEEAKAQGNNGNNSVNLLAALFALGLGLGSGFWIGQVYFAQNNLSAQKTDNFNQAQSTSTERKIAAGSYAGVISRAYPAVVNVFSEHHVNLNPSPIDLFFDELFGKDNMVIPFQKRRQRSLGSGVFISADGYLLTNNHVVQGSNRVYIALSDGRELETKLVGADPRTDLALLKADIKISDKPFSFVSFADSNQARVGDIVFAIGNPYGIGQTVTMGIISATRRENLKIADYEDFIQTDAAINPGNSGGALIDSAGNLIGINTAIYSQSGGYQGIGFAVPANLAHDVADQLKKYGKVSRAYLGVYLSPLEEQGVPSSQLAAAYLSAGEREGGLVLKVLPGSPAERGGIEPGCLITKINDKPVKYAEQVFKIVASTSPDSTLEVEAKVLDPQSGKITTENYSIKPGKT